jgi:hypothetical protein
MIVSGLSFVVAASKMRGSTSYFLPRLVAEQLLNRSRTICEQPNEAHEEEVLII